MHRYKLASNKVPKLHCPACGKPKHWQRYIDIITDEPLPKQYGKCDNLNKCGAWVKPKKNGKQERLIIIYNPKTVFHFEYHEGIIQKMKVLGAKFKREDKTWVLYREPKEDILTTLRKQYDFQVVEHKSKPKIHVPNNVLTSTLKGYEHNQFIQNLALNIPYPFTKEQIEKVIEPYRLGTVSFGKFKGATTFPFIDIFQNVCAIQVKQFNEGNHTIKTTFLHSLIENECTQRKKAVPKWIKEYKQQDLMISCLFGAHLLSQYPHNKIALVEAPKTAIYGTLYFGFPDNPEDFLWLAVYNLSSLTYEKCKDLTNREVVLFPDLSKDGKAYDLWQQKAEEFESKIDGSRFVVSDLLERNASREDRERGLDLADYLVRFDWRGLGDEIKY